MARLKEGLKTAQAAGKSKVTGKHLNGKKPAAKRVQLEGHVLSVQAEEGVAVTLLIELHTPTNGTVDYMALHGQRVVIGLPKHFPKQEEL